MNKKRIALIYGGAGQEHAVSLLGAEYLIRLLRECGCFDTLPVYIDTHGSWYIKRRGRSLPTYPVRLPRGVGFYRPTGILRVDCAFPLLHGDFGEDGRVQGALDCAGISYVGSGVLGGALAADKINTKIIAESLGIPTVEWIAPNTADAAEARLLAEEKLGYPLFVKPSGLGSSVGAAPVSTPAEFEERYTEAYRLGGGRVLVERLVSPRRELECACLIEGDKITVSHPGEVFTERFYSYDEKYSKDSGAKLSLHSDISPELSARLTEYCRLLCAALSVRDLCRIDFFLSGEDIYLNEINTMPGFTESSLYPRLMRESGIGEHALVHRLIRSALLRGTS